MEQTDAVVLTTLRPPELGDVCHITGSELSIRDYFANTRQTTYSSHMDTFIKRKEKENIPI